MTAGSKRVRPEMRDRVEELKAFRSEKGLHALAEMLTAQHLTPRMAPRITPRENRPPRVFIHVGRCPTCQWTCSPKDSPSAARRSIKRHRQRQHPKPLADGVEGP